MAAAAGRADRDSSARGAGPSAGRPGRGSRRGRTSASRSAEPRRTRGAGADRRDRPARTSSAGRRVVDADHRPAGDHAREDHDPVAGGEHRAPGAPCRSTPRWPAANGCGGASKGRVTVSSPASGGVHARRPAAAVGAGPAVAAAGAKAAARTISTGSRKRARMAPTLDRTARRRGRPGDLWTPRNAGETGRHPRVCCPVRPVPTGRLRASSSRRFRRGSRHLGPSGQPPGVWRRWTPGRRTTRCPRQPRSAAHRPRAEQKRLQWQSSA